MCEVCIHMLTDFNQQQTFTNSITVKATLHQLGMNYAFAAMTSNTIMSMYCTYLSPYYDYDLLKSIITLLISFHNCIIMSKTG